METEAHLSTSFISEFSLNVENQDIFLTGYTLVLLIYIIIIILWFKGKACVEPVSVSRPVTSVLLFFQTNVCHVWRFRAERKTESASWVKMPIEMIIYIQLKVFKSTDACIFILFQTCMLRHIRLSLTATMAKLTLDGLPLQENHSEVVCGCF